MTVGDIDTLTPLRHDIDVLIPLAGVTLEGLLSLPPKAKAIALIAYSDSHDATHHYLAEQLNTHGFATLLISLLTPDEYMAEAQKQRLTLSADLLAERLYGIIEWIARHNKIGDKPLCLVGTSTDAASVLKVAARCPSVKAIAARSGRMELAEEALGDIEAPTLLIIGSNDPDILHHNEMALVKLNTHCHLEVVPGASHWFEEPGTLEKATALTLAWLKKHTDERIS